MMLDTATAVKEFEQLERRLLECASKRPVWNMQDESVRAEVKKFFIESQGFDKIPMPEIKYHCVSRDTVFGCRVERLAGTSWENCAVSAHLFLPPDDGVHPVVLIACGHGETKLGYCRIGAFLAQNGIACLVPDNIGQLERKDMGHWKENAPFALGFSFISMLTIEALANLKYLHDDPRFSRIGAAGNSGGGLLTLCLAALAPDYLEAIASTGYPSSFEWICRKRKRHCGCNLFAGVIGKIEHEELYSLFSPRPLCIMQGIFDNLLPLDVFNALVGKLKLHYTEAGVPENFSHDVWYGPHPWCKQSGELMRDFFCRIFKLEGTGKEMAEDLALLEDASVFGYVYDKFPEWALNTEQLSYQIAGKEVPAHTPELYEIWKPEHDTDYPDFYPLGETKRIMAQWKLFIEGYKRS